MRSRPGGWIPAEPPALGAWLLGCLAPRRVRDVVLGDLQEEYARFTVETLGSRRAALWYWRQVVSLLIRYRSPYAPLTRCFDAALTPGQRCAVDALSRNLRRATGTLWAVPAVHWTVLAVLAVGVGAVAAGIDRGGRADAMPSREYRSVRSAGAEQSESEFGGLQASVSPVGINSLAGTVEAFDVAPTVEANEGGSAPGATRIDSAGLVLATAGEPGEALANDDTLVVPHRGLVRPQPETGRP